MSFILPAETPRASMIMEHATVIAEMVRNDLRLLRRMFLNAIFASKVVVI